MWQSSGKPVLETPNIPRLWVKPAMKVVPLVPTHQPTAQTGLPPGTTALNHIPCGSAGETPQTWNGSPRNEHRGYPGSDPCMSRTCMNKLPSVTQGNLWRPSALVGFKGWWYPPVLGLNSTWCLAVGTGPCSCSLIGCVPMDWEHEPKTAANPFVLTTVIWICWRVRACAGFISPPEVPKIRVHLP